MHCDMIVTNETNIMQTQQCFNLQNSYKFRASLSYHHGLQSYKKIARQYYYLQYKELW